MKKDFDFKVAHLEDILTNEKYKQAMKKLKYEEKEVLYYLAVEEYSLKELSKWLNISKRKVRKRKKNAIEHFKHNLKNLENLENEQKLNTQKCNSSNYKKKFNHSKSKSSKKGGEN